MKPFVVHRHARITTLGADYRVLRTEPSQDGRWQRRTTQGWMTIKEPKTFLPSGAEHAMHLLMSNKGTLYLLRAVLENDTSLPYNITAKHYTIMAKGTKAELWELFLAHGRMTVTS
jgi:hypothetical protein